MRRSDHLAQLSRDHHRALAAALALTRASAATAPEARAAFLAFFEREGREHFRLEEELLLPAVARHLPPAARDAIVRVLAEHAELRRRAAELAAEADPPLGELHELGELLRGHVRHEERVLFELIEAAVPEEELVLIAQAMAAHAPA